MKKSEAIFGVARVPLDALAVLAALLLAFRLRQLNIDFIPGQNLLDASGTLPDMAWYIVHFIVPSVGTFLLLSAVLGLYTLESTMSAWVEVGRVILVTALWVVLVIAWYFLVRKQLFFSRALLLYGTGFIVLFVEIGRAALTMLQRSFLRAGMGRRIVVSLGTQGLAEAAQDILQHDEHYAYLGHIPDLDALKRILHQQTVDLVLQTDPNPGGDATITLINYCRSHQVGYAFLPPVLADVPHQLRVERLGLLPMIRFQPTPLDGWGRVLKRVFDIIVSFLMIILLSPLLLLFSLLVLIGSGWPIFYVSQRVGEQGRKKVSILKFRSMVRDADLHKDELLAMNHRTDGPLFKIHNDPRVTGIGKILRRFSLDELPQLFNVFIGNLSLVGPRPHLPAEVDRYSLEQRRVFAVKPGATGLAQISGRSSLSFDEEVRLDLQYIEEWSLLLDLWILWRTMFTVFSRRGAD
ncbi:exopolysaccharide biosynthesis polyprenyl glycosylphosphotransferase [Candidatus Peribacteria bacterium]|nr:exopolysaccharide biosynthesis polyprenyl glycosylphosphotransferase [Candidatus Peribacteria bacterium]